MYIEIIHLDFGLYLLLLLFPDLRDYLFTIMTCVVLFSSLFFFLLNNKISYHKFNLRRIKKYDKEKKNFFFLLMFNRERLIEFKGLASRLI